MGVLQERITSTRGHYHLPPGDLRSRDDYTDPAPATTFAHLDATTELSREIASRGLYPAVDPLTSTSRILDPRYIGADHYASRPPSSRSLRRTRSCRRSSRSWVSTSSRKRTSRRGPRPPHPAVPLAEHLHGQEVHGCRGVDGAIKETIESFDAIVKGEFDHVAEQAFFNVGGISDVEAKWAQIQKGTADMPLRVRLVSRMRRSGQGRPPSSSRRRSKARSASWPVTSPCSRSSPRVRCASRHDGQKIHANAQDGFLSMEGGRADDRRGERGLVG